MGLIISKAGRVAYADFMGILGFTFLSGQDSILIVLHQIYYLSMGSLAVLHNGLKYCLPPGNFMALG